jgi:hypothetical protein
MSPDNKIASEEEFFCVVYLISLSSVSACTDVYGAQRTEESACKAMRHCYSYNITCVTYLTLLVALKLCGALGRLRNIVDERTLRY